MTKKRTADSKFSEFKGGELFCWGSFNAPITDTSGDFNKYTAQSYTIRNGVEIFGGKLDLFRFINNKKYVNKK